ncbi:degT/DnrJ/EryC1/StrS aminotransferase [Glycomyces sp. NPDC046736]|uniref:degT/DnrJ/EryC1/StrS aminotransferase n=1 Tax=Glycomyces sp. NPDC046736 TaxID=3155615 RepID=UPI0033C0C4AA
MELFDTAVVLTRVMTSGTVMSIEKGDRELPGLERLLAKATARTHVSLVNSSSAAVHAAVAGQGLGYGDRVDASGYDEPTAAFLAWLGIESDAETAVPFARLRIDAANAGRLRELAAEIDAKVLVVDLCDLGFGPAAAVLTDDETVWARAERLKIFGAFDLRTMWTQEESNPDLVPGVQCNYRLSPLVAACVRVALNQAAKAEGAVR